MALTLPIPTLLLSPEECRARAGVLTPTLTGAVRTQSGQYGSAWFVEEGTTNLITNPRLAGTWVTTGMTRATVTDDRFPAGQASEVTMTNANTQIIAAIPIDTQSGYSTTSAHTGSAYISVDDPTQWNYIRFRTFFRYADASTDDPLGAAHDVTLATTPVRHVHIKPIAAGKTVSGVGIYVYANAKVAGAKLRIGSAQLEAKAYETTYADGSRGTGYTWAGTANASSSTRAAGSVRIPNIDRYFIGTRGTILVRSTKKNRPVAAGLTAPTIFDLGNTTAGTDLIQSRYSAETNFSTVWYTDGVFTGSTSTNADTRPYGAATNFAVWWDGTAIGQDVRGVGVTTGTRNNGGTVFNGAQSFWLGSNRASQAQLNGQVESVLVFDRVLTTTERDQLLTMSTRWTWDTLLPHVRRVHRAPSRDHLRVATAPTPEPLHLARTQPPEPIQTARARPAEDWVTRTTGPDVAIDD